LFETKKRGWRKQIKTNFMKTIYFTIITALAFTTTSAQTLQKSIVNSLGESVSVGKLVIHTSVGDPIVYSQIAPNSVSVSQGFFSGNQKKAVAKIEDVAAVSAAVYPNPFRNQITLKLSSTENTRVEIYNTIGEKVYDAPYTQEVIALGDLAAGMYTLRTIQNNKQVSVSKISKQ
jgi:hypothetical protein